MRQIRAIKPIRRIATWYSEWASTLDSAGRDSRHVQERAQDAAIMTALWYCLHMVIYAGELTDRFKRFLFYGQNVQNIHEPTDTCPINVTPFMGSDDNKRNTLFRAMSLMRNHRTIMLIHSVMGLVTESAELALIVKQHIFEGKDIDWVNVHEELGDVSWYVGIGAKAEGLSSIEQILVGNHDKLVSRYGDTWGHDRALEANRDRGKERGLVELSMVDPVRPTLYYLASPRRHDDPEVVAQRVAQTYEFLHYIMLQDFHVFSPIIHNHRISEAGYMKEWADWKDFDTEMLYRCDALIVLTLPGWEESEGVRAEIDLATRAGMVIKYMEPVTPEHVYQEARNRAIRHAGGPVFVQKEATV